MLWLKRLHAEGCPKSKGGGQVCHVGLDFGEDNLTDEVSGAAAPACQVCVATGPAGE